MLQLASLIDQLKASLRGEVLTDDLSRGLYATDASFYQMMPHLVVMPRDEEDVRKAVALAAEAGMPILPRGGGTSLAGQTVARAMVLDVSKYMNQLLEVNVEEGWARVQPGLVRDELNALLKPYGFHFAPDPATSSRANVGGMIGNNSSGTKSILYGKTVDHVLGLKVLLADGTSMWLEEESPEQYARHMQAKGRIGAIYRGVQHLIASHREEIRARYPKVMRRVGGYNLDELVNAENWNLAKLLVGSEGTLGITLEAKIRLTPLPKHTSVCVAHFSNVLEAIRAVQVMLEYQPSAVEILDETVVSLSRENLLTARHCHFIAGDPAAILIVEFYGDTAEEVRRRPEEMVVALEEKGYGYAYPIFTDEKNQADVWVVRKKGLGLMLGIKGTAKPLAFIEDAGIPVAHLPEYIDQVLALCKSLDVKVAMYAHASVGVIHVRPILDLRQEDHIRKLVQITEGTFQLVMKYGGSWSGEHGDGLVRSPYNERFFGPRLYGAFKELKRLFDPQALMNPGKIVEAPPMDQNLRYGADYRTEVPDTHFHFRAEHGFEAAIDMCTGVGECRKTLSGTMCPSFMATREEEHATRGRANALRLAMSGQLGADGLTSPRLREALDLCLSCKGCKAECPSNVDMAKLKSETSQLYYDRHGTTLRDRLIRDAAQQASRFSGGLADLINGIQASKPFRAALARVAGFHPERVLPAYARQSFGKWFRQQRPNGQGQRPPVALFADTYLNYHEPRIGKAAKRLLEACGYEVLLAEVGCCQRPRISHGFLKKAKADGLSMLQQLDRDFLQKGIPVVVCEPSCASALLDDLPDLLEEGAMLKRIKERVSMIDVFLAKEKAAGRMKKEFRLSTTQGLLHGHCHQKALFGTDAMKQLVGEEALEEIPSGCCGMAGSFGYEQEHYELSRNIGEQKLFPAVRQQPTGDVLIACGVSCRHQISHFTGREARHWVECVEVVS